MATQLHTTHTLSNSRAAVPPLYYRNVKCPFSLFSKDTPFGRKQLRRNYNSTISISRIKAINDGGDSYLDMWKKAAERERKSAENSVEAIGEQGKEESPEELEKKNREFQKLLEVSVEERDRVQRMQVTDRAAAAGSCENSPSQDENVGDGMEDQQEGMQSGQPGVGPPDSSFRPFAPPPNPPDADTD